MNIITSINYKKYYYIGLLVLIPLIVYWRVYSHKFIHYDDQTYLTYLIGLYGQDAISVITSISTDIVNANWHPVTLLSLFIDFSLSGGNPAWFHISNLIIHILNGIIVYVLFNNLSFGRRVSFVVALIFMIHPIQVETVAWVAERKGLLAAFFALLSTVFYIKYVKNNARSMLLFAALMFLMSLMSKASLIMLPIMFLMIDWWPMRRINNTHELLEKIKEKYVFIIVAILFSIITIYVHSKSGALTGVDIIPFGERVIHVVLVYVKYLQKFVYPFELSIVYPYQLEDKWLRLVIAILLLALITIAALKAAKRFPYILFGWSWFVVMLFPLTGLIQSGRHDHADRYMYFPVIGLLIASIFLILNSMNKLKVSPFIVRTFLVMTITVLAIVATITVTPWKNTYTIFFNALLHTDNNYIAHGNLAINFLDDGDIEKGMFHYEKSRSIIPKHVNLYDGMSHKLVSIKEYDLALTVLNDAIESGIENGEIYRKIGQIELLNENYHNSIENFRKAKLFNPNLSGVSYGLAYSYYSLGNYGSALDYLLLEIKIDPDNDYAKRLYVDICKKIPDSKNCDKYKQ